MELQDIINLIKSDKVQVVSFDIFDTLLMRPVMEPMELFRLVGRRVSYNDDFVNMRIQAEKRASRKNSGKKITDFNDIYREFSYLYQISDEMVERLKMEEKNTEMQYLYPRQSAKKLFDAAKEANKHIMITSDMYLEKSFLEEVLKKNHYEGYENFYLSNDKNCSKRSGLLYELIKKDYAKKDILPEEILHIGDNRRVDVDTAIEHGLQAVFFEKAIDLYKKNKMFLPLHSYIDNTMDNNCLVAFIAQRLFDDPFAHYNTDTYFNKEWRNFGNVIIGPLLMIFVNWMLKDSINDNIKKIIFLYRDGYLPKKVFDIVSRCYQNPPDSEEAYLNRSMMYSHYGKDDDGLYHGENQIPVYFGMTVEEFIKTRCLASQSDEIRDIFLIMQKYDYPSLNTEVGDIENKFDLWKELQPYFRKNAEVFQKNIENYCYLKFNSSSGIAIFDVGYRGRACRFLKDRLQIECVEYQICSRPEVYKHNVSGYRIKGMLQCGIDIIQETKVIFILLDDVLSIQQPGIVTIDKINEEYIPVYEKDVKYSVEIEEVQQSVISWAEDFVHIFQKDLQNMFFDPQPFFYLFRKWLSSPSKMDADLLESLRCPDDPAFVNGSSRNKYFEWYQWKIATERENVSDGKGRDSRLFRIVSCMLEKVHILSLAKKLYYSH